MRAVRAGRRRRDRNEQPRRTAARLLGGGALAALAEMGLIRASAQTCEHCEGNEKGPRPDGHLCTAAWQCRPERT